MPALAEAKPPRHPSHLPLSLEAAPPVSHHDPLLRTLYIISSGVELGKRGEAFVVSYNHTVVAEIPSLQVDIVVLFGRVQVTTPAMHFCLLQGVRIVLLAASGRLLGLVEPLGGKHSGCQRLQAKALENDALRLAIVRSLVRGKLVASADAVPVPTRRQTTAIAESERPL